MKYLQNGRESDSLSRDIFVLNEVLIQHCRKYNITLEGHSKSYMELSNPALRFGK